MDATSIYQCHAFHESLSDGKTSGDVTLTEEGLRYCVGHLSGLLPFSKMILRLGGAGHRLVFITHPSVPDLTLYTSDLSILKNPVLRAHPECAPQIIQAHKKRHANRGILFAIACVILLVPVVLIWKMDRLSGYAVHQIPVAWEIKMGESVAAQYRLTHTLMPKEDAQKLLQPLVAPLINALHDSLNHYDSPYHYDFTIVNDGALNAFALPGGYVTINSGLILKADNAEELLGVLAHEINHVEQRHGVRSIVSNAGIYLVASVLFGDVSGLLATVAGAAPMLISQTYSRGFETEADEKAVELMRRAKINPQGLPDFFEKMIVEEKATLDKIENEQAKTAYKKAMTLLSTHPASETRMAHLRELIGEKKEVVYINQDADFKALKDAVKKFVGNETNTPTMIESQKNTSTSETKKEAADAGNH